jgi:hypothetical protein
VNRKVGHSADKLIQSSRRKKYGRYKRIRINKEYHSACTLVGIGTLPTPLSPASVPLPPEPRGALSPAGEGLGESQFRRLEKKLSTLPTLWGARSAAKPTSYLLYTRLFHLFFWYQADYAPFSVSVAGGPSLRTAVREYYRYKFKFKFRI